VLCVDDDPYLTDLLSYALTRQGHKVQLAASGSQGLLAALADRPDLALLDGKLPDMDGFELCTRLRTSLRIPVIMLTARGADEDILSGFANGADDYVTKPFSMQILMSRVEAVLRRSRANHAPAHAVTTLHRLGSGMFNAQTNEVSGPRGKVKLTRSEARILLQLLCHQGQILSAEQLLVRVWGHETESDASVIKTHIRHIRSRLAEATGDADLIQTVRGLGYSLRQSHRAPAHDLAG
jgi:two-component system OmpR family response regulator